jgi:hypothetical protein
MVKQKKAKPKYGDRIKKTEPEKTKDKENKTAKPKINETVRFIYIVMLVIFVPLAVYLLATFQLLAFFIMVGATFVLMQIINWAFKRKE